MSSSELGVNWKLDAFFSPRLPNELASGIELLRRFSRWALAIILASYAIQCDELKTYFPRRKAEEAEEAEESFAYGVRRSAFKATLSAVFEPGALMPNYVASHL